jgi:repressor LexA
MYIYQLDKNPVAIESILYKITVPVQKNSTIMPKDTLTARQSEILDLIRGYIADEGCPPTRAEIARTLGFRSPNAAEDHLRALQRKGYIEIVAGSSRGIRLLDDDFGLPVVGRVAAGEPILAEQHIEDHQQLEPGLFHPRADYLLRVHGDSMKDAGILDNDLLAVHSTPNAENGQIVVARIDDEVTVKRFQQRGSIVRLLPENPAYEPIRIDLKDQPLVIEGLAVGVLRKEI